MDIRALLLNQHALIHSVAVATADNTQMGQNVWARLSEPQLRQQLPGHNSVAWIFWHITRWEDAEVNCLLRAVPEVLDAVWLERLGVDTRDAGTGASDEDVSDFSRRVDLAVLKEYRDAVGRETRSWLENGDLSVLDTIVDISARLADAPPFLDAERAGLGAPAAGRADRCVALRLACAGTLFLPPRRCQPRNPQPGPAGTLASSKPGASESALPCRICDIESCS
ncbi:MAG TPA: DinB family protein [Dehalococcoidia bacterium]